MIPAFQKYVKKNHFSVSGAAIPTTGKRKKTGAHLAGFYFWPGLRRRIHTPTNRRDMRFVWLGVDIHSIFSGALLFAAYYTNIVLFFAGQSISRFLHPRFFTSGIGGLPDGRAHIRLYWHFILMSRLQLL